MAAKTAAVENGYCNDRASEFMPYPYLPFELSFNIHKTNIIDDFSTLSDFVLCAMFEGSSDLVSVSLCVTFSTAINLYDNIARHD